MHDAPSHDTLDGSCALIPDIFEMRAQSQPKQETVACGPVRRSWGDFNANINRVAQALYRHGIGSGQQLAMLMGNAVEMLEIVVGIVRAAVPLSGLRGDAGLRPPGLPDFGPRPGNVPAGPDLPGGRASAHPLASRPTGVPRLGAAATDRIVLQEPRSHAPAPARRSANDRIHHRWAGAGRLVQPGDVVQQRPGVLRRPAGPGEPAHPGQLAGVCLAGRAAAGRSGRRRRAGRCSLDQHRPGRAATLYPPPGGLCPAPGVQPDDRARDGG